MTGRAPRDKDRYIPPSHAALFYRACAKRVEAMEGCLVKISVRESFWWHDEGAPVTPPKKSKRRKG